MQSAGVYLAPVIWFDEERVYQRSQCLSMYKFSVQFTVVWPSFLIKWQAWRPFPRCISNL